MPKRPRNRRREANDTHRHDRKAWQIGRYSVIEHHREKHVNKLWKMITGREYKVLSKYLTFTELFSYMFHELLTERLPLPRAVEDRIREKLAEYRKLAIRRWFERIEKRLAIYRINHPVKVNMTISYSELKELATLARLAWESKSIELVPLNATLVKHLWCNSSRIFIRWDGVRGDIKLYIASNVVKDPANYNAPATPDNDTLNLPMINIWIWKYEDDWTSILDALLEHLDDLAENRVALTRNGNNEPVHTVPAILAIYTDYPAIVRSIVVGMPELSDVTYHCSAYYMPTTGRNLTNKRPHRRYEAFYWRRYRRMEGWA